ncbi:MAG: DUF1553 domain-containing protein [Armatimonadota bacterium]
MNAARGIGALATTAATLSALAGSLWARPGAPPGAAFPDDRFEKQVRPLLASQCLSCHGTENQYAGLRLDKPLRPGQAPAVLAAVEHTGQTKMPPSGKLKPTEIAVLREWVNAGAPFPKPGKASALRGADHWAWKPVRDPLVPPVDGPWSTNPIDAFVDAKRHVAGLRPAPEADRRTLIRRATYDLTGLPPTPAEVDAFLADRRADAWERLIDRLLASPAYGEKWGRHWLDVARYADSNGLDENLVFRNAYRYRDWVISAINRDIPVDRFIRMQVAGDLMPEVGPEGILATGYLALGAKMLAEDDPVKQEYDIIDEQVDTLGKTFLGLTIGCARCHDHKFDPFPQTDYYALAGIFKSTKTMTAHRVVAEWLERPVGAAEDVEALRRADARIAGERSERDSVVKAADAVLLGGVRTNIDRYLAAARTLAAAPNTPPPPAIDRPDGTAPGDAVVREAEAYDRGNVTKDFGAFGHGIGVLVNRGEYPNLAEYVVELPRGGAWQLDLRNASGDPRGFRVYVNDMLVADGVGAEVTGGFLPEHQRWTAQGVFAFQTGRNTLRFERDSYFPHIDKWLLRPVAGDAPPTVASVSAAQGLDPRFLSQALSQVRAGKSVFEPELPDNRRGLYPADTRARLEAIDARIAALEKVRPDLPRAMAVDERETVDLKLQFRGNYLTEGAVCQRAFPTVLRGENPPAVPAKASGRRELAEWMTRPTNPLTSRVFVNRVWRWHFGRGLVATPDNFGTLGEAPSHPELLDHLATAFVRDDHWSLKALHRRIMTTRTYRMASTHDDRAVAKDPADIWLWRFPRRRLTVEELRDSIHFVAGTLDRGMGGSLLGFRDRQYVTDTANADPVKYDTRHRAVYLPVVRSATYDLFTAFDFGDPSVMNGDRPSTVVAPQALFLMNGDIVLREAKALAARARAGRTSEGEALRNLWRLVLQRDPTPAERNAAAADVNRFERAWSPRRDARDRAWWSLAKSLLATNAFLTVE